LSTRNRRRAERIEVGIPAQIYTSTGFLAAKVCDLSRTGLRLRIQADALGMQPTKDMGVAARRVADALAPHFALDLDYEKFGPLLQRGVELTRIGLPADGPGEVEICCAFDEPLDDHVTGILDAQLPAVRDDLPAWTPEEDAETSYAGVVTLRPKDALHEQSSAVAEAPASTEAPVVTAPAPLRLVDQPPAVPAPRHRYRALVTGTSAGAPPAFFCHTDLVTVVGVRVRLPRPEGAVDIRKAMSKLMKVHGSTVDVRILDESEDVWAGAARVTGVELPTDRLDVMLVTLAYQRPLGMAAMRRLGLVSS